MIIIQVFRFITLLYLLKYYPVLWRLIIQPRIQLFAIMLITNVIVQTMERMGVNILDLFF